jgi:hypothetical protein
VRIDAACFTFCFLVKVALHNQLLIDWDDIELFQFDKIDKMPSEWSDTEKQSL